MKHKPAARSGTRSATAVHAPGWVEGISALTDTTPATELMVRCVGCGWLDPEVLLLLLLFRDRWRE